MHLIEDIQELLRINTEYDAKTVSDRHPYGEKIAAGLAFMEERARQDGFAVKNVDGRALAILLGEQKERVEATSHIDVVPAVGEWSYPPYSATLVGNRLYGRGSQDMKTQIMLTYYALKKIRAENLSLKRQIRVVIGTDEENSMQDIAYYLEKEGLPDFAFTPDSRFPVCLGEKGAITWKFTIPVTSEIISLKAGTADNVVCPELTFTTTSEAIAEAFRNQPYCEVVAEAMVYHIKVIGKGAHTSMPEEGRNAIVMALTILKDVSTESWIQELYATFYDMYGAGLGLEAWYEPMGYTSVGLNVLNLDAGHVSGSIDIRYPNPLTRVDLETRLATSLPSFELKATFDEAPIETQLDNPFVQAMLSAYHKHYPQDQSEPFYSGGVTYSKMYQNRCVAFGPELSLSTQPTLAHQVDEYVEIDELETLVDVYKEALIAMANV